MQLSKGEEAMGLSFYAVGEHLEGLLADAGYTFHEGDDGAGRYGYWFCWTDGKCDIETGETRDERLGALMDAADHWFTHARIPTDTDDDGCPVGDPDCLGNNGDCHDACEAPQPLPQWIPVSERLPDNGTVCLIASDYGVVIDTWRVQHDCPGLSWVKHEVDEVTHWMPLPQPPITQENER